MPSADPQRDPASVPLPSHPADQQIGLSSSAPDEDSPNLCLRVAAQESPPIEGAPPAARKPEPASATLLPHLGDDAVMATDEDIAAFLAAHPGDPTPVLLMCRCKAPRGSGPPAAPPFANGASVVRLASTQPLILGPTLPGPQQQPSCPPLPLRQPQQQLRAVAAATSVRSFYHATLQQPPVADAWLAHAPPAHGPLAVMPTLPPLASAALSASDQLALLNQHPGLAAALVRATAASDVREPQLRPSSAMPGANFPHQAFPPTATAAAAEASPAGPPQSPSLAVPAIGKAAVVAVRPAVFSRVALKNPSKSSSSSSSSSSTPPPSSGASTASSSSSSCSLSSSSASSASVANPSRATIAQLPGNPTVHSGAVPAPPPLTPHHVSNAVPFLGGTAQSQSYRQPPNAQTAVSTPTATAACPDALAPIPASTRVPDATSAAAPSPSSLIAAAAAAELQYLVGGPITTHLTALQRHPEVKGQHSAKKKRLPRKMAAAPTAGVSFTAVPRGGFSQSVTASPASLLPFPHNIPRTFHVPPVLPSRKHSTTKNLMASSLKGPLRLTTAGREASLWTTETSSATPLASTTPCQHLPQPAGNLPENKTGTQGEAPSLTEPATRPETTATLTRTVEQDVDPSGSCPVHTAAPFRAEIPAATSAITAPQVVSQRGRTSRAFSGEKSPTGKPPAKIGGAQNASPHRHPKSEVPLSHLDRLQRDIREAHRRRKRLKPGASSDALVVRSFALLYNECSIRTMSQWVTIHNTPGILPPPATKPLTSNLFPTSPAQFRKCSQCGRYGHYSVLCPALLPDYANAVEHDLAQPSKAPPSPQPLAPLPARPVPVSKTSGEKMRKVTIELCEGFLIEQSNKPQSSGKRQRKRQLQGTPSTTAIGSRPDLIVESTQLDLLLVHAAADAKLLA